MKVMILTKILYCGLHPRESTQCLLVMTQPMPDPSLKLKELLAAEKHVSCNIQYIYTSCVDLSCVGS